MSHAFNTIATIYVLRSRVHTAAMGEGAYSLFRMVIKQTTIGGLLIMVLAGAQIGFGECACDFHVTFRRQNKTPCVDITSSSLQPSRATRSHCRQSLPVSQHRHVDSDGFA